MIQIPEEWGELLAHSDSPNDLFRSPEWFENKLATKPQERVVLQQSDTGLALLLIGQQTLRPKIRLRTAQVLGAEPLGEMCDFFKSVFARFPIDAVTMRLLPTASPFFHEATTEMSHVHERMRLHLLKLPPTFEEYLARFSSKHRKNLTRTMRLLTDHRLQSIDSAADVSEFLRVGASIARVSWQSQVVDYLIKDNAGWLAHLSDLAERRLLRSYLLWCGERPCAYVLGFQYRGYFHYSFIGHDPEFDRLSPGTVMLLRIIEDLIAHNSPTWMNFGEGDALYKERFGSDAIEVANVTVFRPTVTNWLRLGVLRTFETIRRLARLWREARKRPG